MSSLDINGFTEVDPLVITDSITAHFKEWFARAADSHPGGICREGANWRELEGDWAFFHETYKDTKIPEGCLRTLHRAICFRRGDLGMRKQFSDSVMTTPSMEEFVASVRKRPPDSAPAVSGLSNNMIQLWPDVVLQRACEALVALWIKLEIPEYWRWRYLVLLPKKPEPTLNDLRPLTLVETIRKIWVAIFVTRIQTYVACAGVLSPNQHAYLWGKGTDTATIQLIHALETAKQGRTNLYMTTWDKTKAFDSVSKAVLIFTWVRIGVPPALAEYMVDMDIGGALLARMPLVTREVRKNAIAAIKRFGFETEIGAGQGDIPSPVNYDCFEDILLTALELQAEEDEHCGDFYVPDETGLSTPAPDIGFSDDLATIKAHLFALQRSADIVSAFCILFDVKLSMAKFRAFMVIWGNDKREIDDKLVIHTKGWVAHEITLVSDGSFKHLGVVSNLDASSDTQFDLNKAKIVQALNCVKAKRLPPVAKIMGVTKSLFPQVSFNMKFSAVPLKKLEEPFKAYKWFSECFALCKP
jgi:hypothetical protein